jgi:alpha-beta hydrolase superfamily lysophospholipase
LTDVIDRGAGERAADLMGTAVKVFTYRPEGAPRLIIAVFHGLNRDAGPYRDNARVLADRIGAIVVAPELDADRFSIDLYQRGGVAPHGTFVPPGRRTVDLIAPLMAWARTASGRPNLPHALVGHSAGGQFLSRVAAFAPTDATHFVIANPSTWVLPSTQEAVPYGFGGTPAADEALRAYLALPITALLGTDDIGTHNLSSEPEAVAQGVNRLERGRTTFAKARAIAHERDWRFGWKLVEVPGVGHNALEMFGSGEAAAIFR